MSDDNQEITELRSKVADLTRQLDNARRQAEENWAKAEALREAGDEMWYAARHRDKSLMADAIEDWQDTRGIKKSL